MTDKTRPISASNPPESKVHLREQHSPVFDADKKLQKDQRKLDLELEDKIEEVEEKTESKKKRTKVTDA